MNRLQVKFWLWVTKRMPKRLIYFAAIQLMANVTTQGKLQFTPVSNIGGMEAIGDYARRYRLEKP